MIFAILVRACTVSKVAIVKVKHRETSVMNTAELAATGARAGRQNIGGLLAADESTSTIAKRFAAIKLESTEEKPADCTAKCCSLRQAVAEYISGG